MKKFLNHLIYYSLIVFVAGCSAKENSQTYTTEAEAEKAVIKILEEKYHKPFTLVGEGEFDNSEDIEVFKIRFKDEEGLEAEATLPQQKKIGLTEVLNSGIAGSGDTYSQVVYTKKAREAIEPLFEGEPFEKYYINLANAGLAKENISLSADEYFQKTEDEYDLSVILSDNKEPEYYAKIIYPFYEKITTEQKNTFGLSFYANDLEIFSIGFVDSEHFYYEKSYEEILERVTDGLNYVQPQPDEEYLRSEYYNGEE